MNPDTKTEKSDCLATMADYDAIVAIFKQHRSIFPHVRTDYIRRMIESKRCFFKNGVVITFTVYQRSNMIGNFRAHKGSICIKQIAAQNPGNGNTEKELNDFLSKWDEICFLSVRADNDRAIRFYKKTGFIPVGKIEWNSKSSPNGKISGIVFQRLTKPTEWWFKGLPK
jgi:hypothetical protein